MKGDTNEPCVCTICVRVSDLSRNYSNTPLKIYEIVIITVGGRVFVSLLCVNSRYEDLHGELVHIRAKIISVRRRKINDEIVKKFAMMSFFGRWFNELKAMQSMVRICWIGG